jgi:alkylhydroperoxidase family enzyme
VTDHRAAGLDDVDVAVMDLAETVADDAGAVTQADIDRLRALGLSDAEIFDVVATSAARCFFTKIVDGLGAQADSAYAEVAPGLREVMTVGRPIED